MEQTRKGVMTVRRRHHHQYQYQYHHNHDGVNTSLTSLRVADPTGRPCCILTVLGNTTAWIPGNRVILQLDFPRCHHEIIHGNENNNNNKNKGGVDEDGIGTQHKEWLPCYQVSACLTAEEVAVYEDGSKKRTRLYDLDTCHEPIDPTTTERVCLSLFLPMDCPCSVQTDIVEISLHCRVDITVGKKTLIELASLSSSSQQQSYNNLRLDLPCRAIQDYEHDVYDYNDGDDLDEEGEIRTLPIGELLIDHHDESNNRSEEFNFFERRDIMRDLKVLSMQTLQYYNT
jgi:hypothetical protein